MGIMRWADGSSYEGNWYHDLMHGKGIYTFKDKRIYDGMFNEGK